MDTDPITVLVLKFIEQCKMDSTSWKFASKPGGEETLYGSCFACMLYHYLGELDQLDGSQKQQWADYLNSWQDPDSGYFIGPELIRSELTSPKHSYEHLAHHLTVLVLPALKLLGYEPVYPLTFAHSYLVRTYLKNWLNKRDWRDAWLEGNNLLFVGQLLIYLRDVENISSAQAALNLYFDWLDQHLDPKTGLWGTNGYCSSFIAMCGGYHQLLVYYYENRNVMHKKQLIDTVLSLQHTDGGFHPNGGGGACEDVDAADILVNMYKQTNYKRPQIRYALRKTCRQVLKMQMPDGGFVYRLNESFIHMGIKKTASGPNQSNIFSTWFRIHTLALISEILTDGKKIKFNWQFNNSCSMGWHLFWDKDEHRLTFFDRSKELLVYIKQNITNKEWYKYYLKRILPSKLILLIKRMVID